MITASECEVFACAYKLSFWRLHFYFDILVPKYEELYTLVCSISVKVIFL